MLDDFWASQEEEVTIPSLMISLEKGNYIKDQLKEGKSLGISLVANPGTY